MISVIVPVYKAEKYLHRCINSILAQTYTDFELILVDDGSPDNSGAICDEYAAKDNRVKVIHKENGGVTAARADGVKISKGDYITFVDADDTIPCDSLNVLFEAMTEDIDIVIGSLSMPGENKTIEFDNMTCLPEEYLHNIITMKNNAVWGRLFRRNIFNSETFDLPRDIVYGEDTIMNIRLALRAKRSVKYISDIIYFYETNLESCVHTFDMTFEYHEKWYSYIYASIPQSKINLYIDECIRLRITYINYMLYYYINKKIWGTIGYHKQLKEDVKHYKVKIKLINHIALLCNNPISCKIYLLAINSYVRLKNILKKLKSS